MGNTDDLLVNAQPGLLAGRSDVPIADRLTTWVHGRLADDDVAFLAKLPLAVTVPLGDSRPMMLFHGSPHSYDDVVGGNTPAGRIGAMLADIEARVFVGGPIHIRLFRQVATGIVMNPGSVGLPGVGPGDPGLAVNQDVHGAEYAIVTSDRHSIRTALHRVALSMAEMLDAGRWSGMPGFEWWASKWQRA